MITDLDDNQISAFYPGAMKYGHTIEIPKKFGHDDFLVIAPSSAREMDIRSQEGIERGIPYLFDPGQQITTLSGDQLWQGASFSEISIFNDYEWQMFQEKTGKDLDDLIKLGVAVIVTKGEQGSVIRAGSEDIRISAAKPSKVVDPTGAGDAYRAGIIGGFVNKWDWQIAGQVAATVASFAVEEYGTQEHNPPLEEIKARYEQNFDDKFPT